MPDRDYEQRDELLDRGWQKMSGILDHEMPQRKSRRHLFLWIPLGFLGILAVSWGIWSWSGADSPATPKTEESIVPKAPSEASDELQIKEKSSTILADADQIDINQEKSTADDVAAGAIDIDVLTDSPTPHLEVAAQKPVDGQVESSLTVLDNNANSDVNELEISQLSVGNSSLSAGVVPDIGTVSERKLAEETIMPGSQEAIPSLEPLMALNNQGVTRYKRSVTPILPAPSRVKSAFGLDAYLATHWTTPVRLQGLEGGILATWKASPRISISGGAAYGHHRKLGIADLLPGKSSDAELANVQDPLDTTSFGGGNIPYDLNRVGYDTAEHLVNKLNYLHLPLFVEYRATRNLSIRLGARASYMLGAPVSQMGRVLVANPAFPGQVVLDADPSSRYLLREGVLKRWDVAPMIGIGWDVSRLLAIDINYQHGLIPYIDRDAFDRSDYNRTLSVGLRVKML